MLLSDDISALDHQIPFDYDSPELRKAQITRKKREPYMCPLKGSHFHTADLYYRINNLKKKRDILDTSIAEEDMSIRMEYV